MLSHTGIVSLVRNTPVLVLLTRGAGLACEVSKHSWLGLLTSFRLCSGTGMHHRDLQTAFLMQFACLMEHFPIS